MKLVRMKQINQSVGFVWMMGQMKMVGCQHGTVHVEGGPDMFILHASQVIC